MGRQWGKMVKRCSWAAAVALLLCSAGWRVAGGGVAQAQEGGWSPASNLSNTPTKSWLPSACADRTGNVHVVWAEFVDPNSTTSDTVYYTMWDGAQWTDPAEIAITGTGPASQAINAVWYPAIAADDWGRLHLVWTDTHSIYYSQAFIGGEPWKATAWSSPRIVFLNPNAPGGMPHIAVDGRGGIHIVFNTLAESYHIASADGGRTWSEPVSMAESPERATRPRLFVDDQNILHVGISEVNDTDNGIAVLYTRSFDGGQTWDATQELSAGSGAQYPIWPAIGKDGQGSLHAVWPARYDRVFYHQQSDDGGGNWSRPEQMASTVGEAGFGWPSMATDSAGNLHLLLSYNDNIYHLQWDGAGWTVPVDVSVTEASSNMPSLVITAGNRLHAIWMEYAPEQRDVHDPGNTEIYYRTWTVAAPARPEAGFLPVTTTPVPTATAEQVAPATATAAPTRVQVSSDRPGGQTSQTTPLLTGIVLTAALMTVVVVWYGLKGRE